MTLFVLETPQASQLHVQVSLAVQRIHAIPRRCLEAHPREPPMQALPTSQRRVIDARPPAPGNAGANFRARDNF